MPNEKISLKTLREIQKSRAESARRLLQNFYKKGPVSFDIYGLIKTDIYAPFVKTIRGDLENAKLVMEMLGAFTGECFSKKYGHQWYTHDGMPFLLLDGKNYFNPKELVEDRFLGHGIPLQKLFIQPPTLYDPSAPHTELKNVNGSRVEFKQTNSYGNRK